MPLYDFCTYASTVVYASLVQGYRENQQRQKVPVQYFAAVLNPSGTPLARHTVIHGSLEHEPYPIPARVLTSLTKAQEQGHVTYTFDRTIVRSATFQRPIRDEAK